MKLLHIFPVVLVFLLAACASQQQMPSADAGLATDSAIPERGRNVPFAGLGLEDAEEGGALVIGMIAGPAANAGMLYGDRILRIGDIEVDAAEASAIIAASLPGTKLSLHIMRGDLPLQVNLVIDTHERWSGPAAYLAAVPYAATRMDATSLVFDPVIEYALSEAPEVAPISQRLDRMFADLARDDAGYHKLPLIRTALMQPGSMSDWRESLVTRIRDGTDGRSPYVEVICETLALTCPGPVLDSPDGAVTITEFAAAIETANRSVREVFHGIEGGRAQAVADLHYLLEKTAADRTLLRQPETLRGIRAMQLSMRVDLAALLEIANRLLANAQRLPAHAETARKLPAALARVIQGEIVDYVEVDGGYIVIGGIGSNGYDMDRIYAVIDLGGDDVYRWGDGVPLETQTVIDQAGDDRYEASRGGPAAGWLGVSVLFDHAGDDHYETALGGCGAGALGFGLLFDEAGIDTYHCAAWSAGTGLYGGGVLVDRGAESDAYLSEVFSQGVGGPRGFGLLLDAGGAELYRANGPVPSAYGTPASYMAFSQGVGVGIRPYDYGGVGALLDLAGDDRYEGGEFSQGGGYFWGVGLLHDEAGNDLYYGNRYAQGFAAHQAFGMLVDVSGDDIYWSMAAAGQAAAWDQSVAMLIEGGGNDVYRAASLSQGTAAQQSRASLHDVAGDDIYWASSDVAQGAAGDNSYHFLEDDPIYSFGVLLDATGSDRYSTGLADGETRLRLIVDDVVNGRGVAGMAMDSD